MGRFLLEVMFGGRDYGRGKNRGTTTFELNDKFILFLFNREVTRSEA
jgi:hypothetical protein